MDTVRINEKDNVCVNLETGHKIAVCDIAKGADIIKYGYPIGYATEDIKEGESVHSHNMKTKLGDILSYEYTPCFEELTPEKPFEINVGAMTRGYRTSPYPAEFILKEINRLGGKIVINGDCHEKERLGDFLEDAAALAKECGFSERWILTKNGWVAEKL